MSDNPLIGHGNNYYGNTDPLGRVGETPQQPTRTVEMVEVVSGGERRFVPADPPTATPEQGKAVIIPDEWEKTTIRNHEYSICPRCGHRRFAEFCGRCLVRSRANAAEFGLAPPEPPAPASLADVPRYFIHGGGIITGGIGRVTVDIEPSPEGDLFKVADIEALVQRLEKENAEVRDENVKLLNSIDQVEELSLRAEQAEASLQQIRGVLQAGLDRDIDDTTTYGLANVAVNGLAWAREENAKLRESLQQLLIENKRLREDAFVRPSQLDDFEEGDPDS